MSEERLCRAFNLTLSPKDHISDECLCKVKSWLKRTTQFCYAVCEHGGSGKRHLHAAMFFLDNKNKKNINDTVWKIVRQFHGNSVQRYAVHLQVSPGRKWVDEYLQKEDGVEIILNSLPPDTSLLDDYFPDEEVQAALVKSSKKDDKVWDTFYHYHEIKYKEWLDERTYVSSQQTAMEYFHYRMFVTKDMRVNADSRKVIQQSLALHRYSSGEYKCTAKELRSITEEHSTHDFNCP